VKKTKTEGGERHPDEYLKNVKKPGLSTSKYCKKEGIFRLISRKYSFFVKKKTAICLLQIAVFWII
jgi:hypothetical protein